MKFVGGETNFTQAALKTGDPRNTFGHHIEEHRSTLFCGSGKWEAACRQHLACGKGAGLAPLAEKAQDCGTAPCHGWPGLAEHCPNIFHQHHGTGAMRRKQPAPSSTILSTPSSLCVAPGKKRPVLAAQHFQQVFRSLLTSGTSSLLTQTLGNLAGANALNKRAKALAENSAHLCPQSCALCHHTHAEHSVLLSAAGAAFDCAATGKFQISSRLCDICLKRQVEGQGRSDTQYPWGDG